MRSRVIAADIVHGDQRLGLGELPPLAQATVATATSGIIGR
jgi:hypothetical protein